MFTVSVNGKIETLPQSLILDQAMQKWGFNPNDLLVIAINQTIVPQHRWADTEVRADDQIDILQPIVGG